MTQDFYTTPFHDIAAMVGSAGNVRLVVDGGYASIVSTFRFGPDQPITVDSHVNEIRRLAPGADVRLSAQSDPGNGGKVLVKIAASYKL